LCDALRYVVFTGEKTKISLAVAGAKKYHSFNEYGATMDRGYIVDSGVID